MSAHTVTWYIVIDGETDTFYERGDLDTYLHSMARTLVDQCEQEILEGGHWGDDPSLDAQRIEIIEKLADDITRQVENVLSGAHHCVTVDPWYARAQRMTFSFKITETDDEDDDGLISNHDED